MGLSTPSRSRNTARFIWIALGWKSPLFGKVSSRKRSSPREARAARDALGQAEGDQVMQHHVEALHVGGGVVRHHHADVAGLTHGAPVEAGEPYGGTAALLHVGDGLHEVLGPRAR